MNNTPEFQLDFCPYQGLEPFAESDKDYFVGRDADTRVIASNLLGVPLSVLYGVSGVGKSSVLLAGVVPRLRKNAGLAVTVFRHWQGDQFAEQLKQEIAEAVKVNARPETKLDPSLPFDEFLRQCNEALDGPVFLLFDQWEEYFLYHPAENSFDLELARAISRRDVTAHFLFAMREEELSKLDRFRTSIPNVLGNMLRLKHLDPAAAEAAIRRPLEVYNSRVPADRQVAIEDDLVNSLIEKSARRDEHEQRLTQSNGHAQEERQIATPVLQLLLTRLWDEERQQNSTALRAATLDRLGGAQNVVDAYFESVVEQLPGEQRNLAGRTFGYLVTPAGNKFAQTPATLARWARERDEEPVRQLLDGLAMRSDVRILRKVVVAGRPDQYEIFHDVLGPSILKWQQRFEQEQEAAERERERQIELERAQLFAAEQQKRVKLFRRGMLLFGALLLGMFALTAFAFQQRTGSIQARTVAEKAQKEADDSRQKAEQSLIEANIARADAENQKADALNQRNQANAAKDEAEKQKAIALDQRNQADAAKDKVQLALSGALAANSAVQLGIDQELSLRLAVEAMRVKPTAQAEDALRNSILESRLDNLFSGHTESVTSAVFSPNGQFIVTASEDKTARVWQAHTGHPVATLRGHTGSVRSAVFSPDGQFIVTSGDKTARVWQAHTGEPVATLSGHTDLVNSAVFSPDNQFIVTASDDQTALIWQALTGQLVAPLRGHRKRVNSAAFSPDGQFIVTASEDQTARVWQARTGQQVATLGEPNRPFKSAVFSPDGQFILTAGGDLWQAHTGKHLAWLGGFIASVHSAVFSRDGQFILISGDFPESGTFVRVLERTGQLAEPVKEVAKIISGHSYHRVNGAVFSPDGQFIVTSGDGTAQVWQARTGQPVATLSGHAGEVNSAVFSPDGQFILTASHDGTARVWRAPTGQTVTTPSNAQLSPDGQFMLTIQDKTVQVRQTRSGQPVATLSGLTGIIKNTTFSPDGQFILTMSGDFTSSLGGSAFLEVKTVQVWQTHTGQLVATLRHEDPVERAFFSPDGQFILTTSGNITSFGFGDPFVQANTVQVWQWQAHNGEPVAILRVRAHSAYFSPDGQFILTVSGDNPFTVDKYVQTMQVWKCQTYTGEPVATLSVSAYSANFSPDGQFILTSQDKTARVWQTRTGQPVTTLSGHTDVVYSADFSPDGQFIVTASTDKTARVWQARTGQPVATLIGHTGIINSTLFSPDGQFIVTASEDKTARVWRARTGQLVATLSGHKGVVTWAVFSPDGQSIVTSSSGETERIYPRAAFRPISELLEMTNMLAPEGLTKEERERYLPSAKP